MGKCRSPFGKIRKSIGPLTFAVRNGEQIVYMKPDAEKMTRHTTKVINGNTLDFFISRLYNELFKKHLRAYWNIEKEARKGQNLMSMLMKVNCGALYKSMPDKSKELGADNWVNMEELRLTYKYKLVEPIRISGLTYKNKKLTVRWDTKTFIGGQADDVANVVGIYCKPMNSADIHKRFEMEVYYKNGAMRKDGEMVLEMGSYEKPDYITGYLFFSNGEKYSHSVGLRYGNTMETVK